MEFQSVHTRLDQVCKAYHSLKIGFKKRKETMFTAVRKHFTEKTSLKKKKKPGIIHRE